MTKGYPFWIAFVFFALQNASGRKNVVYNDEDSEDFEPDSQYNPKKILKKAD